ncbi:unnamed protein product [Urochloa decumbens]|uniref:[RNA-polymerase]-subunit kinase n=1 Tax=Urochloa decumbens TaxID=240449 RepID=A0ABC9EJ41_9POAL
MGTTEDYDYEDACRLGERAFGAVIRARHRPRRRHEVPRRGRRRPGGAAAGVAPPGGGVSGNPLVVASPATLRDALLRQPGPLPESTVRVAMWQLPEGAKRMHAAHIVHRDIKPHNILLGDDRVARLCDFGLAVHMSEPPPYGQAGTLWYMAPKVLLGMPDYDALVDSWSLGCVMARLLGGEAPFQGADEDDQLSAICVLWCKYPDTKLSEEGFEVLSGLLRCNPDKRLTAAAALKHPWFSEPELPRKEVVPPLTKRQRLQ